MEEGDADVYPQVVNMNLAGHAAWAVRCIYGLKGSHGEIWHHFTYLSEQINSIDLPSRPHFQIVVP